MDGALRLFYVYHPEQGTIASLWPLKAAIDYANGMVAEERRAVVRSDAVWPEYMDDIAVYEAPPNWNDEEYLESGKKVAHCVMVDIKHRPVEPNPLEWPWNCDIICDYRVEETPK